MKSFFSRLQSKFDASYGGRYVETILQGWSQAISAPEPRQDEAVFNIKTQFKYLVNWY